MSDQQVFSLCFGVLSPSISDQAFEQGYKFPSEQAARLADDQKISINKLRMSGALTDSETDKICKRVLKAVCKQLQPIQNN